MIPYKTSFTFFSPAKGISLVLFLLFCFPFRPVNSCVFPNDFRGYSFLDPALADIDLPFTPYLLSFEELTKSLPRQSQVQQLSNVEEWSERHCRKASPEDIEYLIYRAPISQLQSLKRAIVAGEKKLGASLVDNSFAAFIFESKCMETMDYLLYARACEPHVLARDYWDDTPRDTRAMQELIDQGKTLFLKLESHYIRLRYAYQMIRLAHYMGDYEQTLELYDYLIPKIDADPSILDYWILGHKAGAMMSLGQNVEASYLFSIIFEKSEAKRESAWNSFNIKTDEEWQACLNLCLTDRERAGLYVLRAYKQDSRLAEEMQHIYEIDPTNPNLELLLIRELQKLEKDLLGLSLRPYRHIERQVGGKPRPIAGKRAIELLQFVKKCTAEQRIARPLLWQMAQGYLEMLSGDPYFAGKTFEKIRNQTDDPVLAKQLQAMQLALNINSLTTVNDSLEREIADWYEEEVFQEFEHFEGFLEDKLSRLYREGGHPGKALRIHYSLTDLKSNPDLAAIDDLINLCKKERRTPLERKMVVRKDGSTIINDLYDLRATLLLSRGMVEAALKTYKEIDRALWDDYGVFNPFVERLKPCVECPLPDSVTTYNKGEVLERLVRMEYDAKADPENGAVLFYKLGIAWLNMSYFGHAWEMADLYRSGGSLFLIDYNDDGIFYAPGLPLGNTENFDLSKALDFFERSIALTKNPELAARASFMAAFCEQQDYYLSRKNRPMTFNYFEKIRVEYPNTDFYQYLIEECKYFSYYTTR